MVGVMLGLSPSKPHRQGGKVDEKYQRKSRRLWLKAKRVCRLSSGCHSPIYRCSECPYNGGDKSR